MKTPTLTLAAAMFALATGLCADGPGTLRFLNDDAITGRLQTLAREHVVWDSSALERPATFFTEEIRDLVIDAPVRLPDSAIGHEATLTLTNGDVVRGQLASVTDQEISLDTWYAGRLVFRRVMVRDLAVREMPEFLFRGPGPLANWLQPGDSQAWTSGDANSLVSHAPGAISRDIPLPEEFSLEFEVQWQGSLRLQLVLLSKDASSADPKEGYDVMIQRQTCNVRRREGDWIGQNHRAYALQRDEKATIRLQISQRTGKIAYFVNDKILDVWTDPEMNEADLGTAMHFVSLDNSPLVISRIDVSKWDGTLDEEPKAVQGPQGMMGFRRGFGMEDMEEETPEEKPVEDGTMVLRNGDRIRGTVKSIQEGKILVETPFREVTLPVERLRTIALAPASLEEPKRENGDIRAWFAEGGSIVFRLEGVSEDGKALLGYSQTFGNARFDLSAFNRVEFNIYPLYRAPR